LKASDAAVVLCWPHFKDLSYKPGFYLFKIWIEDWDMRLAEKLYGVNKLEPTDPPIITVTAAICA